MDLMTATFQVAKIRERRFKKRMMAVVIQSDKDKH
jgi:hypothetical protein